MVDIDDFNKTLHSFLISQIKGYQEAAGRIGMKGRRLKGSAYHNFVIAALCIYADRAGAVPIPEYMPYANTKHRIDLIWVNKDGRIAAFEVDRTIYPKSIKKLCAIDASYRCIVSMGKGKGIRKHLLEGTEVHWIDCTDPVIKRTE